MPWYTAEDNAINLLRLDASETDLIRTDPSATCRQIADQLVADLERTERSVVLAIDGFKGARFGPALDLIEEALRARGIACRRINVNSLFRTRSELTSSLVEYERPDDPSFGRVFYGEMPDLMNAAAVADCIADLQDLKARAGTREVVLLHGPGATAGTLAGACDRVAYIDVTREQLIIRCEGNVVPPLGSDEPDGFPWKRIYYVEYPVLNRHKKKTLRILDWYIDDNGPVLGRCVPADIYHRMIAELARMPVSFKVFYMPGTFGGTEFGKRFGVKRLPNTSWDYEISVGDNHMLVDPGNGFILDVPFYNLIWEQPIEVLGVYSSRTYPDHFPIAIYMQDGNMGDGTLPPGERADYKRTHMPHHLHPDTAYCREHFGEPIGRYETYYIVRADEGACTMHGFQDDADIDEYIEKVREAARTKQEFDWRKYIYEHPSKTGELHQLPPGTVHGTGGRQIILEIDTNPSRESTEYSFYLHDYCRSNFNYAKNDFTGAPAKLQIDHSLAMMRRNRRQGFMSKFLRPAPVCIRSGEDWREMSFPMYYNMPYQVNRLEFTTTCEDKTDGLFHCLALTKGTRALVRSKRDPLRSVVLEDCDNVVLPAGFGEYVCENLCDEPCEIIKTFLITEARDHIDMAQEIRDMGDDTGPQRASTLAGSIAAGPGAGVKPRERTAILPRGEAAVSSLSRA